jgi:hypothetical protein
MPEIEIRFISRDEYERLRTIRDKYGVTWRGMLIHGATRLEGRDVPDQLAHFSRDACPSSLDERTSRPDRHPAETSTIGGDSPDHEHEEAPEQP